MQRKNTKLAEEKKIIDLEDTYYDHTFRLYSSETPKSGAFTDSRHILTE